VIVGLGAAAEVPGVTVFHAGTAVGDGPGEVRTAGGRVLDVTALGATLAEARDRAYTAAGRILWPGLQYRRGIAARAAATSWSAVSASPPADGCTTGSPRRTSSTPPSR